MSYYNRFDMSRQDSSSESPRYDRLVSHILDTQQRYHGPEKALEIIRKHHLPHWSPEAREALERLSRKGGRS